MVRIHHLPPLFLYKGKVAFSQINQRFSPYPVFESLRFCAFTVSCVPVLSDAHKAIIKQSMHEKEDLPSTRNPRVQRNPAHGNQPCGECRATKIFPPANSPVNEDSLIFAATRPRRVPGGGGICTNRWGMESRLLREGSFWELPAPSEKESFLLAGQQDEGWGTPSLAAGLLSSVAREKFWHFLKHFAGLVLSDLTHGSPRRNGSAWFRPLRTSPRRRHKRHARRPKASR